MEERERPAGGAGTRHFSCSSSDIVGESDVVRFEAHAMPSATWQICASDIAEMLAENMDEKCFRRSMKLRDRVETMSIGCVRVRAETHKEQRQDCAMHRVQGHSPHDAAFWRMRRRTVSSRRHPSRLLLCAISRIGRTGADRYEAFRARGRRVTSFLCEQHSTGSFVPARHSQASWSGPPSKSP